MQGQGLRVVVTARSWLRHRPTLLSTGCRTVRMLEASSTWPTSQAQKHTLCLAEAGECSTKASALQSVRWSVSAA